MYLYNANRGVFVLEIKRISWKHVGILKSRFLYILDFYLEMSSEAWPRMITTDHVHSENTEENISRINAMQINMSLFFSKFYYLFTNYTPFLFYTQDSTFRRVCVLEKRDACWNNPNRNSNSDIVTRYFEPLVKEEEYIPRTMLLLNFTYTKPNCFMMELLKWILRI